MYQDNSQKQKILIVDDSEINRSILADILSEEYDIFEAADGVEAIEMLQEHTMEIAAVLLDINMPRKNGFEVLAVMNQKGWIDEIPVIIISAESGSNQVDKAYNLGVTDFISRPFDAMIVHRRVVNTVLLYMKQRKLYNLVVDQINEKERLSNMMVDILSHIVEFRNGESGEHVIHIHTFTEVMLRQLQRMTDSYALTKTDIVQISLAAALHDIGKIAIDEKILNKPGKLTDEEFEKMKMHSAIGAQMLEKLPKYQDTSLVKTAREICRWHHERFDGKGYPDGLKGDEIPISAQIVALADVYDALISDRCYKKAIPHDKSIQMILNGECGAFNPLLLECLKQVEGILRTEFHRSHSDDGQMTHIDLVKEMLRGEKVFASKRSLDLIDRERFEHDAFSAATEELSFRYSISTDTLRTPAWSAERLGIDELLVDPLHNERILQILGESAISDIQNEIHKRKPDDPVFYYDCRVSVDESPRWYRITVQTKWLDGECSEVLGKAIDIHSSRMQIDELEKKASYDTVTGLLNRASAKERILHRLQTKPDGNFALAIFDVDYFKSVNDTYGHIVGDRVLAGVAKRARQSVRGNDIVARVGGDEFLIFMEYKTQIDIEKVIERIFNSLIGAYDDVQVKVSMGAAKASEVSHEYTALFHAADQALYSAKRDGRCKCLFYNDSMRDTLSVVSDGGK